VKKRTRSRELALQFLYQLDLRGAELLGEAREFVRGEERDAETARFALQLVEGTHAAREELDREIQAVAQNWSIGRMAVIDRNVLRLASYELLHCPDVPPKVAINEAIELGKRYSTQNSGAFINGILDKIMNRAKKGPGAAAPLADAPEAPPSAAATPADAGETQV
jgi:N utilization substance protein B